MLRRQIHSEHFALIRHMLIEYRVLCLVRRIFGIDNGEILP